MINSIKSFLDQHNIYLYQCRFYQDVLKYLPLHQLQLVEVSRFYENQTDIYTKHRLLPEIYLILLQLFFSNNLLNTLRRDIGL